MPNTRWRPFKFKKEHPAPQHKDNTYHLSLFSTPVNFRWTVPLRKFHYFIEMFITYSGNYKIKFYENVMVSLSVKVLIIAFYQPRSARIRPLVLYLGMASPASGSPVAQTSWRSPSALRPTPTLLQTPGKRWILPEQINLGLDSVG